MKKLLIFLIFFIFILSYFVTAESIINERYDDYLVEEYENIEFTHNVLAEQCTATWCPNCPIASEALKNIYDSGDYSFYYVSLVDDMNPIAKERNQDYSFGFITIYAFPTIYFDGGNTNFIGKMNTIELTESKYRDIIESEGQRNTNQPIKLESSVSWAGNARINVVITVTNEGSIPYIGRIRSYVTEIESRWVDEDGNYYKFGFLDYAINQFIILMPNNPKTITGTFDGNSNHGGNIYDDITQNNIQVISSIFHFIPKLRDGYQGSQYNQRYLSFVVDQTTAATPE
jgi:hypothetical protein